MNRVVHFEIHADDPDRAAAFYRTLFGWEIMQQPGSENYWSIKTGAENTPGINGGLLRRTGNLADHAAANSEEVLHCLGSFVCTIDVASLDETIGRIKGAGGWLVLPKTAVPGVGWLAYGRDTEGNIFGMMQDDPAAK